MNYNFRFAGESVPRPVPGSPDARTMKKFVLALLVIGLYAAHHDIWFWTAVRPLVFGFLPISLFYHASYTVAACLLMVALVKLAWPEDLSRWAEEDRRGPGGREGR